MSTKTINTTVELLGRIYPIRCPESEINALQQAASFLNQKMQEVEQSGKVMGIDRIAIITALNLAHQLLHQDQQKTSYLQKLNQRITQLQDKIETTMNKTAQAELIYTTE